MTNFFYDLNKKLNSIAPVAPATPMAPAAKPVSKLSRALTEGVAFAEEKSDWKDLGKEYRDKDLKKGDVRQGHKHDTEKTNTGVKVTRRVDPDGMSVGTEKDDEGQDKAQRSRGRPKGPAKGTERVTGKATKHKDGREKTGSDGSAAHAGKELQGFMVGNKPAKEPGKVSVKHRIKEQGTEVIDENDLAGAYCSHCGAKKTQHAEKPVVERSVSKAQVRTMGAAAHNPKFAKKVGIKQSVAKEFNKDDAGKDNSKLPEKVAKKKAAPETAPKKVKEAESTSAAPKSSKGGVSYGKGIYDSLNRSLENLITEGMTVNVTMGNTGEGGQPTKNISVTADGDDADKLAELLKMAGVGSNMQSQNGPCSTCGQAECGCSEVVDENSPDWPSDSVTSNDPLQYAGGLNKPKTMSNPNADDVFNPLAAAKMGNNSLHMGPGAGVNEAVKNLHNSLYKELQSFKK